MTTIAILAIATCGIVWAAALVEFFRTWSELGQGRSASLRIQAAQVGAK